MCTETSYTLRCEHVVTKMLYCADAYYAAPDLSSETGKEVLMPCEMMVRTSVPWPPPEEDVVVACPLGPDCPFESKGGFWNCCWCGKEWNERGRCACVMLIDGQQFRCDHICCNTCEASRENVYYYYAAVNPT
ncbi:hypothetical protein F5Y17DRAFT_434875 [Xylariaceae sp. FL0594]|nr:hypothetical protein F5Y17DRAFT_434875 [Xylariaceae sp. FL0594]